MFRKTPKPSFYNLKYFTHFRVSLDDTQPCSWSVADRERKSLFLLTPQRNDMVLDIGCGRGTMVRKVAGLCREVIGMDPSVAAVGITKRNNKSICNSHVIMASAVSVPLRSDVVDKIYMLEVIEHLDRADTVRSLSEIQRILRLHGTACLSTPHLEFPLTLLLKLYRIATREISLHVDEKGARIFTKLLRREKFHFKVILEKYRNTRNDLMNISAWNRLLLRLKYPNPCLSTQMWVVLDRSAS